MAVWATWPALDEARTSFLAEGLPVRGTVAPGDHLQTAYNLWLPGHQLERGAAPWVDPYSFQPEADPRVNFAGWPFGLVFWPLERVFGTVAGWNLFVLATYLGAGGFAALWLRALGLGSWSAAAGGVAFALAPYLVGQSAAGHLLAPVATLLPLALWAWERGRPALAAAALASIPLSGQVHFALAAVVFFAAYAAVRPGAGRARALIPVAAAVGAGLLVYAVAIRGTTGTAGRSFAQVERYSAELADFVAREPRQGLESFVFLGWVTPVLALVGLVALVRSARGRLALVLAGGAAVPLLLTLGGNLPGYETLWRHLPGLEHTRVPERLVPVACLAVAALVAFAFATVRLRFVVAVAIALIALDLRVDVYRPSAADPENGAYAALAAEPAGRLLEVPIFLPDRQEGSVYLHYAMQAPRERPAGYSTTAPRAADQTLRRLRSAVARCDGRALDRLGVRYVAVVQTPEPVPGACLGRLGATRPVASDREIVVYDRR